MKVEVTIPENISDITLGQYMLYETLMDSDLAQSEKIRRKINIFTSIPYKDTEFLTAKDSERISYMIDIALTKDAEFKSTFKMLDIEFGFIPNFDKITGGEYADICKYANEKENVNKLMAVLFRPIVEKKGSEYRISEYISTEEYRELMKQMPLSIANGAVFFFLNLTKELENCTQKYLSQTLLNEMKPPKSSRISVGIQRLKNWLTITYLKSKGRQN